MLFIIIIIIGLLVNLINSQCSLRQWEDISFCGGVSDLNVYGSIPKENNDAATWGIIGAQTAIQWAAAGAALTGTISGPFGAIISSGVGNLIGGLRSTVGDENNQLELNQLFEKAVTNELNRLEDCIDEAITDAIAELLQGQIVGFLTTFSELANPIEAGDRYISNAINQIERFEGLIDRFREFLPAYFDTKMSDREFVAYIPVFNAYFTSYDQIMSSYLSFLDQCETDENYADLRDECQSYRQNLVYAAGDIELLIEWIETALPAIQSLYIAKIDSLDLNDRSYQTNREQKGATPAFKRLLYGKSKDDGEWLADAEDKTPGGETGDWVDVRVSMYGYRDCSLGGFDCSTRLDWYKGIQREYTEYDCRNQAWQLLINQYNRYQQDMENWRSNFMENYITPAYDLQAKVYIMAFKANHDSMFTTIIASKYYTNQCLAADHDFVYRSNCNGAINQIWAIGEIDNDGFHTLISLDNNRCLDANYNDNDIIPENANDGLVNEKDNIHAYTCHGRDNQKWRLDRNIIRNKQNGRNYCLDFRYSDNPYIWTCNKENNNQMVVLPGFSPLSDIRSAYFTNQCLTVNDDIGDNVYRIDCNGAINQTWQLGDIDSDGFYTIISLYNDECLDADYDDNNDGLVNDGDNIHTYTCHGRDNQKWKLDGDILRNKANAGKYCLDLRRNSDNPHIWTCDDNNNNQLVTLPGFSSITGSVSALSVNIF